MRGLLDLADEGRARIAGKDRFCLRSWAFVVVGSPLREERDVLVPTSLLRGVEGGKAWPDFGEVCVVGRLGREDWDE
jgi:hypothetical protein